jgi:mono/diheme cytochrome c family protein
MKVIMGTLGMLVLIAIGTGAFIWSGFYNIAADEPHWAVTEFAMDAVRDRSIRRQSLAIAVPALDDALLIRTGAGNYDAMCAGCHLKPGVEKTELSNGLFPTPPNMSRGHIIDPATAFWTIKHGIKMTGMPAWGKSMEDEYIWGMVAFIRQLPGMSDAAYDELVESSAGHVHSPAESEAGVHGGDAADVQNEENAETHVHDDGSEHVHKN